MNNIFYVVLLGVLQGLTEFLPISSSGHLVIFQHFLGFSDPQVLFDVTLHLGTLGAVIVVYRQTLWQLVKSGSSALSNPDFYCRPIRTVSDTSDLKLIWFVLVGSIPTGLIGFLFQDQLESLFNRPEWVALMLIVTGLVLQLPRLRKQSNNQVLKAWHTPLIGLVQGLAIIPGISRSGSTISFALLLGNSPEMAAKYSFLLSIPAILGAVIMKLKDFTEILISPTNIAVGMLISFIIGWLALRFLLSILNRGKLAVFSYYCSIVGLLTLVWLRF